MEVIEKIKKMPLLLAILTLAGLVAPLLALFSVLTGNIVSITADLKYGAAENLLEIMLVVFFSLPVSISALAILRKKREAIYYFLIGWLLVYASPFCLSLVRSNVNAYLIDFLYNLILAVLIGGYLFKSQSVKAYFANVTS